MNKDQHYKEVVRVFNRKDDNTYDFDSHEFINVLMMSFPRFYYQTLLEYIPDEYVRQAYQRYHSQIGKDLLAMQDSLGIENEGKHVSLNYRGEDSGNAKWKLN